MKKLILPTNEILVIREATTEDAQFIINYFNTIAGETTFLSFGAGEFQYTREEEVQILYNYQMTDNQVYFVGLINDQIAGIINLHASQKQRLKHIGEFGLSVRKVHWGKKIGTLLLQTLLEWAHSNRIIRKINLTVQEDNTKAIALYQKYGFEVEGKIRRDSCINGLFKNTLKMGILID